MWRKRKCGGCGGCGSGDGGRERSRKKRLMCSSSGCCLFVEEKPG